jgi:hypothetical protein
VLLASIGAPSPTAVLSRPTWTQHQQFQIRSDLLAAESARFTAPTAARLQRANPTPDLKIP